MQFSPRCQLRTMDMLVHSPLVERRIRTKRQISQVEIRTNELLKQNIIMILVIRREEESNRTQEKQVAPHPLTNTKPVPEL